MAPPVCPANAHEQSFYFVITSYYRANRMKLVLRAIRSSWRRYLFRLVLLMMFVVLVRRKRRRWKVHSVKQRDLQLSSMRMIRIV